MITEEQYKELSSRLRYLTNEELSLMEEYEWMTDPPDHAFLYPKDKDQEFTIVNWMGITFGVVTERGRKYISNLGDERYSVRVTGTNGVRYHGTVYSTYVRLYKSAGQTKVA